MNQQKYKTRILSILLITTVILFMAMGKVLAQSTENYQLKKSAIDQGGAPSQSSNYQGFDAIGQSSAIGTSSSENYSVSSGIFSGKEPAATGVDENINTLLPDKFELLQNYPNPFNPVTHIEYHLPQAAEVELIIYDIKGQLVRQLVRGTISAGYHTAMWDRKDAVGKTVASGMYFYQINIKSKDVVQRSYMCVKKMILMK